MMVEVSFELLVYGCIAGGDGGCVSSTSCNNCSPCFKQCLCL